MFYRIWAEVNFESEEDAGDFYQDCIRAYSKSKVINKLKNNEETPYIQLHRCYHDENPAVPCDILEQSPYELPFDSIDKVLP